MWFGMMFIPLPNVTTKIRWRDFYGLAAGGDDVVKKRKERKRCPLFFALFDPSTTLALPFTFFFSSVEFLRGYRYLKNTFGFWLFLLPTHKSQTQISSFSLFSYIKY